MNMNLTIKDKIYGAFYGAAIGDALGLGSEFMTVPERKRRYPDGLRHYSQIIHDAHRSCWKRGEYTNDTILLLLIAESIAKKGNIDTRDIARRIKGWYNGDPDDICACMRWVIGQDKFVDYPFEVANDVWSRMKNLDASNEALARSVIAGIWGEDVDRNAHRLCGLTHPHPICVTSAKVIANMAWSMMWKGELSEYEDLLRIARDNHDDVEHYLKIAHDGKLEDLGLDDPDTYWYVRKDMAAALWCLWHCSTPEEALHILVDAGGDADTNACLAMALMGLRFGYDAMPRDLIDTLIGRERVEKTAAAFTMAVEMRGIPECHKTITI